jgi:hypothetical protein
MASAKRHYIPGYIWHTLGEGRYVASLIMLWGDGDAL